MINLAFGAGAALSVTLLDASVSRLPAEAQGEALVYCLQHGREIFATVLSELRPYYDKLRPRYQKFLGSEAGHLMPQITEDSELSRLIDLRHVHIHPWSKDGVIYVGLQFGCTWDQEHGLGLLMLRDQMVALGSADVSFAWCPEEADHPS